MWQGHGGGGFFFFFPARSLFLSVLTISLNSHLSFLFKACIGVGLGSWFDLGMVVGWDRLMMGLDWRGSVIFLNGFASDGSDGFDKGLNRSSDGSDNYFFFNGFNCGLLCLVFFFWC